MTSPAGGGFVSRKAFLYGTVSRRDRPESVEATCPERLYTMELLRQTIAEKPSNSRFHLFVFADKLLSSPQLASLVDALASAEPPLSMLAMTTFFRTPSGT